MGRCARCGTENPEGSRFCGGCGRPLGEAVVPARRRSWGWLWGLLVVLGVGVIAYFGYTRWYLPWQERERVLRIPVIADPEEVEGTRIYRLVDGRLVQFFNKYQPRPVMFSPNGRLVVTEQSERMSIWEWLITPQRVGLWGLLITPPIARVGLGRKILEAEGMPLGFSHDGRWFFGLLESLVAVWDARSGSLFRTFLVPGDVIGAGFSAEGVAVVLSDGRVLRWTWKDGQSLPEHQLKVDLEGGDIAITMWPIPGGYRIFVQRNLYLQTNKYQLEQYTLTQSLTRNWSREFEPFKDNETGQIKPVDEGVWVKAIDRGKTVLLLISPEGKTLRRIQVSDEPAWIEFDISRTLVAVHYRFQPCPGSSEEDRERPLCVRLLKLSSGEEVGWIRTAPLPAGSDEEGYPDVGYFMFTPDENFLVLVTYLNLSGD